MKTVFLKVRFVLACAVAGTLSGAMYFPFMIRGAIFGAALAGGAIALNPWRRPASAGPVPRHHVLVAALAVSVVAAGLIAVFGQIKPTQGYQLSPGAVLATSLILSTLLLLGYWRRHLGRSPVLYWFVLAPLLGAVVRASGYTARFESIEFAFGNRVGMSLLYGTYPFILLWLLVSRLSDPAWTRDRWLDVAGSEKGALASEAS